MTVLGVSDQYTQRDFLLTDTLAKRVLGSNVLETYDTLQRYVWRSETQGGVKVRSAVKERLLVANITQAHIADLIGRTPRTILSHLNVLRAIGWIHSPSSARTGQALTYQLGFKDPLDREIYYSTVDLHLLWKGLEGLAESRGCAHVRELDQNLRLEFATSWFQAHMTYLGFPVPTIDNTGRRPQTLGSRFYSLHLANSAFQSSSQLKHFWQGYQTQHASAISLQVHTHMEQKLRNRQAPTPKAFRYVESQSDVDEQTTTTDTAPCVSRVTCPTRINCQENQPVTEKAELQYPDSLECSIITEQVSREPKEPLQEGQENQSVTEKSRVQYQDPLEYNIITEQMVLIVLSLINKECEDSNKEVREILGGPSLRSGLAEDLGTEKISNSSPGRVSVSRGYEEILEFKKISFFPPVFSQEIRIFPLNKQIKWATKPVLEADKADKTPVVPDEAVEALVEAPDKDNVQARLAIAAQVVQEVSARTRAQVKKNAVQRQAAETRQQNLAGGTKSPTQSKGVMNVWRVWAEEMAKHYPQAIVTMWTGSTGDHKAAGQIAKLIGIYGQGDKDLGIARVGTAVRYLIAHWDVLSKRIFKKAAGLPTVGCLFGCHETLVKEADLWAKHRRTLEEWEVWLAANDSLYATPSAELMARYQQAQQELTQLGLVV